LKEVLFLSSAISDVQKLLPLYLDKFISVMIFVSVNLDHPLKKIFRGRGSRGGVAPNL
jgi:hypothetical protein